MKIEDLIYLDRHKVDEESHLRIKNPEACMKECKDQACLYFCPAYVYRLEGDHISVNYEGCLECGSCRVTCSKLNIEWRYPRGGYGISHKFG